MPQRASLPTLIITVVMLLKMLNHIVYFPIRCNLSRWLNTNIWTLYLKMSSTSQVASTIGPIAAECRLTRLCSGSGSPKVSQLWPSNGCQIWLGLGVRILPDLHWDTAHFSTFGPITDHKGRSEFGWDMGMHTQTSLGWVLGLGLRLQCGE